MSSVSCHQQCRGLTRVQQGQSDQGPKDSNSVCPTVLSRELIIHKQDQVSQLVLRCSTGSSPHRHRFDGSIRGIPKCLNLCFNPGDMQFQHSSLLCHQLKIPHKDIRSLSVNVGLHRAPEPSGGHLYSLSQTVNTGRKQHCSAIEILKQTYVCF